MRGSSGHLRWTGYRSRGCPAGSPPPGSLVRICSRPTESKVPVVLRVIRVVDFVTSAIETEFQSVVADNFRKIIVDLIGVIDDWLGSIGAEPQIEIARQADRGRTGDAGELRGDTCESERRRAHHVGGIRRALQLNRLNATRNSFKVVGLNVWVQAATAWVENEISLSPLPGKLPPRNERV